MQACNRSSRNTVPAGVPHKVVADRGKADDVVGMPGTEKVLAVEVHVGSGEGPAWGSYWEEDEQYRRVQVLLMLHNPWQL